MRIGSYDFHYKLQNDETIDIVWINILIYEKQEQLRMFFNGDKKI